MQEAIYNGKIITFYSYKGGTGRTMALANVACWMSLYENKKVLMIDWDLEAPGLHTYFSKYIDTKSLSSGLIDFFIRINTTSSDDADKVIEDEFGKYIIPVNINGKVVSLLKAGQLDEDYNRNVQTFEWRKFFEEKKDFFPKWIMHLQENYDYILIDSRTGLTDISGICTMLMPERVIPVFTPNSQSFDNLLSIMDGWVEYRLQSEDLRPYMIYPLPSRIDISELDLYKEWQSKFIFEFEGKFKSIYGIDDCRLRPYFDLVSLSYIPKYAYGENISVLEDGITQAGNPKLNIKQYSELVKAICSNDNLWDYSYKASPGYKEAILRIDNAQEQGGTWLNLSDLNLLFIPEEVLELRGIQHLDLSNNEISDISLIKELTELNFLSLSNNRVSSIDELQYNLHIEHLFINDNKIRSLTPIKNLTALQTLFASNNEIEYLFDLIELSGLIELHLDNNNIKDLKGVENLIQLECLSICDNNIRDLKPLIYLVKREQLPLRINVQQKPAVLKSEIYLNGNPIENPPLEILLQGRDAVLGYFDVLDKETVEYLYEAKVIVIGQPRAGKTTLCYKLANMDTGLNKETTSTRGIDILQTSFDIIAPNGNLRKFHYNIWDFGGQQIYQSTHQFFLTQRSLYILVIDAGKDSLGNDDAVVNYWLQAIELLGGNSPLMLVQNKKNERIVYLDLPQKKRRFTFLKEYYQVDLNAITHEPSTYSEKVKYDFDILRQDIETELSRLPWVGFPVPKNWVKIKEELQVISKNHPYISLDKYREICLHFNISDYEKQLELSRIFHDLGIFLHFQDYGALDDFIVLQNVWATDAVFAVLDNETVRLNKGKFTDNDLAEIWETKGYSKVVHKKLLSLMMQFELCYQVDKEKARTYIVPDMLPDNAPTGYSWQSANDLPLQYRYDFMPRGLLTRLIVRLNRNIYTENNQQLLWKTGVKIDGNLMDCPNTYAEITEAWDNKQLSIRIQGKFSKDLMSKITHEVDELNKDYFKQVSDNTQLQKSRWYKMIPCNCATCKENHEKHFYDYSELLERREYGKDTVECQKRPFAIVNISELLGSIFLKEKGFEKSKLNAPKKLFISYSKDDLLLVNQFIEHLSALQLDGKVAHWYCTELTSGADWHYEIKEHFNQSDMVVFMVSPNFMRTKYVHEHEIKKAFERWTKNPSFKIVPIILDFCKWNSTHNNLGQFTALPYTAKPVVDFKNQNMAWYIIQECLRLMIEKDLQPVGEDFYTSQALPKDVLKLLERVVAGKADA